MFGMAAALLLQAGFVYAIISGLAATLVEKLPDVLKVDVQQEKIAPKPPPPPPPQVELPPPPVAPPPVINIQTETPSSTITVTNKPPPVVHKTVVTPVGIGRKHECASRYYPEVSVRLNEEGVTRVGFTVGTDGSVSNPHIVKSSGFSRLDDATLQCVVHWQYKPETVDGQTQEAQWEADVQWRLH